MASRRVVCRGDTSKCRLRLWDHSARSQVRMVAVLGTRLQHTHRCLRGANCRALRGQSIDGWLVGRCVRSVCRVDVVSGVSVGALNAAFIATYQKGDEINMADGLIDMW